MRCTRVTSGAVSPRCSSTILYLPAGLHGEPGAPHSLSHTSLSLELKACMSMAATSILISRDLSKKVLPHQQPTAGRQQQQPGSSQQSRSRPYSLSQSVRRRRAPRRALPRRSCGSGLPRLARCCCCCS
jgi:hypothetical protein